MNAVPLRWWPAPGPARRTATDILVTAVVAFPTLMDAWWNEEGTRQADAITYALAGASVGALLARRHRPLAVTVACGLALTALYLLDHHGELLNLPTMVALYTVAAQGHRRRTLAVGAAGAAWSGGIALAAGSPVGSPMLEMLWPVVPLALGEAVRLQHELLAEYEARALRAEADREREARHRVQAERVRMAREVHDLVAHTMAAVNVQMGVAVAAFDTRPEAARDALAQARASSRDALQELRGTVTLLREGPGGDPPGPPPRLAQVGELAETARAAGIAVTIRDEASATDLSAAAELAGHRIVQEALTNIVRHAHAHHAVVTMRRHGSDLVVEVIDDGRGPAAGDADPRRGEDPGGGHGLAGMAERAEAVGGHLHHGPGRDGGFTVRAVLPAGGGAP